MNTKPNNTDAQSPDEISKRSEGGEYDAKDVPAMIIEALNEGDHLAFEYIYLHYSDSLGRFLSSLLRSKEEAEEITQEVFVSLWVKRGIFDPEKGIKRYLYQLAKFHALNHFDKIKVREKYEEFLSHNNTSSLSPDDIVLEEETAILIEMAISRMPPRQRQVFRMSREEQLSYQEISDRLHISKNKVRNYISISLKELREIIIYFIILFISSKL